MNTLPVLPGVKKLFRNLERENFGRFAKFGKLVILTNAIINIRSLYFNMLDFRISYVVKILMELIFNSCGDFR